MIKAYQIYVYGRVQGVFFRSSAQSEAAQLRLNGFASNQPDGSVLIIIEGDEAACQQFIDWCQEGPQHAMVSKVTSEQIKPQGYSDFETR